MKKIGFIGTGSMGSTLITALLTAKTCNESNVFLYNRTRNKAEKLRETFPAINVTSSNAELVKQVDVFFLCIKPGEFRTVLEEISCVTHESQLAISITSPVMIEDLERWLACKVAKIIPSITNQALAGTSLYMPGPRMSKEDETYLVKLLKTISTPLKIEEKYTRIAADLASVSPAFVANILEQIVHVAHQRTGLPLETATPLVEKMVGGVVKLLTEEGFSFSSLQKRVAVPGGITAEGLRLLNDEIAPIFQHLFQITDDKFQEDIIKVKESLASKENL